MSTEFDARNRDYREGRARMFVNILESLAVTAPLYDVRGAPLAGVRQALEAVARMIDSEVSG